eukprot:1684191-Rhodomonas_salina.3
MLRHEDPNPQLTQNHAGSSNEKRRRTRHRKGLENAYREAAMDSNGVEATVGSVTFSSLCHKLDLY